MAVCIRRVALALQEQSQWDQALCQHDQAFARQLQRMNERAWQEYGDNVERPFQPGSPRPQPPEFVDMTEDGKFSVLAL